jgi:hypothetical protein
MLLLHAVVDILPFPKGRKGIWYEIRTGSAECIDEITAGNGVDSVAVVEAAGTQDEFRGIGGIEEDEPKREVRIKVCLNAHRIYSQSCSSIRGPRCFHVRPYLCELQPRELFVKHTYPFLSNHTFNRNPL